MNDKINIIAEYTLAGQPLDRHQVQTLIDTASDNFMDLIYWADRIRRENFGNKIRLCSIVPGRLGGCSEDCAFCGQSSKYNTEFRDIKYLSDDEILTAARQAKDTGVGSFGIVYSGRTISEKELMRLEQLISKIKTDYNLCICAALGIINLSQAKRLKAAGLDRYNHNLETSSNHFTNIVSTHKYSDRVDTIRSALSVGLGVCAGGLFGIGESWSDRIDMAFELRELGVDMVPMNFLHPIEGTPMSTVKPLSPKEILMITAVYRFILPSVDLKVAGGRVLNLRDLQSWIFAAGATAIITGNYLTTAGRSVKEDMQMLADLGLEAK